MARQTDLKSPWATRINAMSIEKCSIKDLNNAFNRYTLLMADNTTLIKWLQENDLLVKEWTCLRCDSACKLNHRSRNIDSLTWRCPSKHECSVRINSIFQNSHMYIPDILHFFFTHAEGMSLYQSSQMSGINYNRTGVEWGKVVRDLYKEYFNRHINGVKFSGIVEIDESLFGKKVKYHKGNPSGMKIWIFGLLERSTNRIKLFPVDDRKKETLLKLIMNNVEMGSTIYSDGWSAYKTLTTMGFKHYIVEHKYCFKRIYRSQENGDTIAVHTNTIEGAWKHAKNHFQKINGTSKGNFEGHLCEIMFRNWEREKPIPALINLIRQIYSLKESYEYKNELAIFDSWYITSDDDGQNDSIVRQENCDGDTEFECHCIVSDTGDNKNDSIVLQEEDEAHEEKNEEYANKGKCMSFQC